MKKEQRRNLGEKIAQGILLIVLITWGTLSIIWIDSGIYITEQLRDSYTTGAALRYISLMLPFALVFPHTLEKKILREKYKTVKLEISGNENDVLIKYLDDIFYGLTNGGGKYQLTTLNDQHYQKKLTELHTSWLSLKDEISLVREKGYQQTNIIKMSEEYFYLADETVTAAEDYSQKCATRLDQIEKALIFVIALVILMMIKESVSAVVLMKKNRELNKKAYIDLHTGLPNRSRVEELIAHYDHFDEPTAIIVFDLNDLKVVNDSLGHLAGDTLIMNFAHIIRTSIPEKYFVGRYGGDEFIALLNDVTQQDVEDIILQVQNEARCYNEFSKQIFIDFAFGYALSTHSRETNLKLLLNQADKNMYECKARMKAKKKSH